MCGQHLFGGRQIELLGRRWISEVRIQEVIALKRDDCAFRLFILLCIQFKKPFLNLNLIFVVNYYTCHGI